MLRRWLLKYYVLLAIMVYANTSWGQPLNNQIPLTKTIQSTIRKSGSVNRVTNQLDYSIKIKNGESVQDYYEYITSSIFIYTYKAHFADVPSSLTVHLDKVYRETWSGSYDYDYYTDLTLTAATNATPGSYKPKIIFDFYWSSTYEETDTVELNVTIYNQPPNKPNLTFPADSSVNQHKNIVLKWNDVPTAKSYVVQLSTDQFFTSVLKADTTSLDTTSITGLAANQKYYWRVQASNSAGASSWSDTWNFTTGLEWEKTNAPSSYNIKCFACSGTDIYAGTDGGGVIHSTDNGMNWTTVNNGLTDLTVQALYISNNNLFAGTYNGGIFLSTNNGSSWTLIKSMYYVNAFTKIGSNLFVGTDSYVYLSKDDGKNWTNVSMNTTFSPIRIYALTTIGTNLFAGLAYDGVWISTDLGKSWSQLNNNYIECLTTLNNKIFAGCNANQGIIRSTDNGVSWISVNTGITDQYIFALKGIGSNLFACNDNILLSTNYGDNWNSVDLGFTTSYKRALGANLNYLFVGTSSDGIWRRRLIEMTGVNSPAKTQLISPGSSQTISADSVTFKWNSVKDATLYLLQFVERSIVFFYY